MTVWHGRGVLDKNDIRLFPGNKQSGDWNAIELDQCDRSESPYCAFDMSKRVWFPAVTVYSALSLDVNLSYVNPWNATDTAVYGIHLNSAKSYQMHLKPSYGMLCLYCKAICIMITVVWLSVVCMRCLSLVLVLKPTRYTRLGPFTQQKNNPNTHSFSCLFFILKRTFYRVRSLLEY